MFSIIQNVSDRKIINQINIQDFILHLKDENREEVASIKLLREIDKKNDDYNKIKKNLPAVCFNYTFKNNYIISKNLDQETGYVYFDIDNAESFDYDTKHIVALWKSVGGKGFGLLVKVKNLIRENFKLSYEHIVNILEIPYDKSCNDCSRINFISYDPNAYYNENAVEIDLTNFNEQLPTRLEKLPHRNSNFSHFNGYNQNGGKIRYDNLLDILATKEYKFNDEGYYDFGKDKVSYCKCYVPRKLVSVGLRNTNLFGFGCCILSINPDISLSGLKRILDSYNSKYFTIPMEEDEVNTLTKSIYKKKGKISPLQNAQRRIIYSAEIRTLSEKRSINGKILGNDRIIQTREELSDIISSWNYDIYPKITQEKLQEVSGKNIKTIEKHYKYVVPKNDKALKK
ncbi:Ca2+-binding EF-hand superfamily protein [Epilithonimonas hungarica]|uniref:BT4734/BF3469 family protein n=1 Tax=Epilithonimonas hungarica TaxID=454006 RepID=UPI00277F34E5|nr:BT4734/BF3469 family protein [Epilithonimonas hungarica]MDP9956853.1 Ca2+-binding EF-hand superfamily protein [Epilithonimonas hungarica]